VLARPPYSSTLTAGHGHPNTGTRFPLGAVGFSSGWIPKERNDAILESKTFNFAVYE
jgi:hypothetical protein